MALIEVSDLENYKETTFTEGQATQAQIILDYINQYIEDESGVIFEDAEGAVLRIKADCDGEIEFTDIPVSNVSLIHDFRTDTDVPANCWEFDGIETICGLYPYQVVDVTVDYTANASAAVYGIALGMASRCMDQVITNQRSDLIIKQVGDVLYQFAPALALQPHEKDVLDRYSRTERTWKLDVKHRNRSRHIPPPFYPDISDETWW